MPSSYNVISSILFFVLILAQFTSVSAADTGNVLAGMIGMVIGIIAICAFLGWWSRRSDPSRQTSGSTSGSAGQE